MNDDQIQQKIDTLDGIIDLLNRHGLTSPGAQKLNQQRDELIKKVAEMRSAQQSYFRTRNQKVLERSKMLEQEVDELLNRFQAPRML